MAEDETNERAVHELTDMEIESVGLVGKAANKRRFLLFKRQQDEQTHIQEEGNMSEEAPQNTELESTVKELHEEVGVIKQWFDRFSSLFKKDEQPPDPVPTVDLSAIEKALADQKAELEKAQARAEEAERIATEERERRIVAEYVEKADKLAIPGKPEELATLMKRVDEMDADLGKVLSATLEAASNAVVQSGILTERGSSNEPAESESPFMDQVNKRAEELRKADPTMTREQAFADAYTAVGGEQPELARQHIDARQKATGRR